MAVKIGVIGLGYWGPNLVRNFNKVYGCQVVACADFDQNRFKPIKDKYPKIQLFTDYKKVIPLVDAVVIATPLTSHFELAREFLKKGKHVLVEKPFVESVSDAQNLVEEARSRKLVLMVDHTFEYSTVVRKVKTLLERKSLGRIFNIDMVRVNLGLFQKRYNVLWDLAPHDVSILLYLLEVFPKSVIAVGEAHVNPEIEDSVHLYLKFPRQINATINLSWLSPTKIRKVTIIGSKKMLEYDDVATEKLTVFDKGVNLERQKDFKMEYYQTFQEFKYVYRQGEQKTVPVEEREPLEVMAEHFLTCISTGQSPLTSGEEGLRVVRVLAAAQKSLKEGSKEVFLDD
jgi:predicted dehydrogenase